MPGMYGSNMFSGPNNPNATAARYQGKRALEEQRKKLTAYQTTIPDAYNRYTNLVYGPEGQGGYVKERVRGVSDAMNPYMNQMYSQGASNVAARGGLATGAQDAMLGDLYGQKTGALAQAGSQAEGDVLSGNLRMLGLAQGEGFKLTDDEIQRLMIQLQKKGMDQQTIGDILGAIGLVAGAAI